MTNIEKLFVFSNTYTARVLLKCLDFMEAKGCVEVILLSEYGVSNSINLDMYVYDSLLQCIDSCTRILVVCDYTISQSKINYVKSAAKRQGKPCVIVNNFKEEDEISNRSTGMLQSHKDTPRLLFVTDGDKVQISCWELYIYKILREKNISVISPISNELNCIVKWLAACNIKCDLLDELLNFKSDFRLTIGFMSYDIMYCDESLRTLNQIMPDVIIVATSKNYVKHRETRDFIKYRYGHWVDLFVCSELIELIDEDKSVKYIFDFEQIYKGNNSTGLLISDEHVPDIINKAVVSKIALPNDVHIIN